MRLAQKLSLAVVAVVVLGFAVQIVVSTRWHASVYDTDTRRDLHTMGRTLRLAVTATLRDHGRERALALVGATNESEGRVRIRWLELSGPGAAPPEVVQALEAAQELYRVHPDDESGPARVSLYVPVRVDDRVVGALELAETLEERRLYHRGRIFRTLAVALGIVLACTLATWLLGRRLVGRPVALLIAKARRIGSGDFGDPLHLRQRDELSVLAEEVNLMAERLATARDELRSESERRVAAVQQLRHADRLTTVGRLASGIAHELGTPLNVVSGRARMISSGEVKDPVEVAENARIIEGQTERMAAIVRQLLDFARRRAPETEPTDLPELVASTLALVAPMAESRRVSLRLHPAEHLPRAEVDAGQIQQALLNLLVNAIDATPKDGCIDVRLEAEPGRGPTRPRVGIRIVDQAEGIPEGHLERIFDPFFTTKPAGQGTGLGLCVAEGIAQEHGGAIEVRSQPGQGSAFCLWLPASAPERA